MNGRPRTRKGAYAREQSLVSRSRTESAREREVFRHLHPWTSTFKPVSLERPAFSHDSASPAPKPVGCPDIALAAFAQLGALRLNAHRCIISLLSSNVEYVLAESTKTISLQYDTTGTTSDELWLGTSSFLRDEGLHGLALDEWHKAREFRETPGIENYYYTEGQSPHWLIISDVRTRTELQERHYIKRGQSVRFFCSVPIRSQYGSAIGSYTVIDDRPRYGISADEMNFLEDMADTVTSHLEATKTRAQRQRSERLIKGLGLFNTGRDSLKQWWLDSDNRQKRRGGRHLDAGADIDNENSRQERLDEEFGAEENIEDSVQFSREKDKLGPSEMNTDKTTTTSVVTRSNSAAAGDRRSMNVASQDFGPSTDVQPVSDSSPAHALLDRKLPRRTKTKAHKEFDLSYEVEGVYARASNLMREAIGAEGVMFLDANMADTEKHRGRFRTDFHDSGTAETSRADSTHTGSASDSQVHESDSDASQTNQFEGQPCDLLGFSTRMKSSLGGSLPSKKQLGLSRDFIERLTLHYPRGKIFNYAEGGSMYSSSGGEGYSTSGSNSIDGATGRKTSKRKMSKIAQEAAIFSRVLGGVRTIAFLPLWDSNRERWRAGALVWSNAPLRYFDTEEDLTYLATFGNSVVAELARLDAIAADTAKTTFISSVSHELRSPLHGVLAGVEFLQESKLTPFQEEMTTTISMAGRTLLDTINHILDYSKINNFTRAQKQERVVRDASRHKSAAKGDSNEIGVTSNVDFARLTEDVVETVVAASRFQRMANTGQADDGSHLHLQNGSLHHRANPVSVVVDIPCRHHWRISMQPGSWTRIVTNLLGNSLKYTKQGVISVKLHAGDAIGYTEDHEQIPLTLTIQDTGIGISKQYMEKSLYTPFMQEDSHSSGTGLGLSIVKQIVHEIGGEILLSSSASWGTKVVINFVGKFLTGSDAPDCAYIDPSFLATLQTIKGKRIHMITPDEHSGKVVTAEVARLRSSLANIFINWLDVDFSHGPSIDDEAAADAYVITETDIPQNPAGGRDLPVNLYPPVKDGYRPPLIVLGSSVQSNPDNVPIRDATLRVFFVSQPIGPRKLARVLMTSTANITANHSPETILDEDSQGQHQSSKAQEVPQPRQAEFSVPQAGGSLFARRQTYEGPKKSRPSLMRRHTEALQIKAAPVSSPRALSASSSDSGIQSPSCNAKHGYSESRSILLVEDNDINMKLLMALMRRLKFSYETAENGLIALEKYSKDPGSFFLILTDISMPVMDGFTATEKIRELEKRDNLERCSIVAITGVSNPQAKERARASGVDKFMTKPMSMQNIKTLVQEVIHGTVAVDFEVATSTEMEIRKSYTG